ADVAQGPEVRGGGGAAERARQRLHDALAQRQVVAALAGGLDPVALADVVDGDGVGHGVSRRAVYVSRNVNAAQMTSANQSSTRRKYRHAPASAARATAAATPSASQGKSPPRHAARNADTSPVSGFSASSTWSQPSPSPAADAA